MERMDRRACLSYLRSPVRTGKLGTVRKDGRPIVLPVWYDVFEETIVCMIGPGSMKARNIRKDDRVSLCVDDDVTPFSYVEVQGQAILSDEPVQVSYWATRLGGRYMGEELAEAYGKINGSEGELVVSIRPTHIHGYTDITGRYPQPAQDK